MNPWNEITALFGGTFNPIHFGHLQAIEALFHSPGIKEVLIIPSGTPPHKKPLVSAEHRIGMIQAALTSLPPSIASSVKIDYCEIETGTSSHRPRYSFETLLELKQKYAKPFAFVIGTDQLLQLHTWYRFPELLSLCHWLVLERKPDGEAEAQKGIQRLKDHAVITSRAPSSAHTRENWQLLGGKTQLSLIPTPAPALSATQIRESIAKTGVPPTEALPPPVIDYLRKHSLYGTSSPIASVTL